MGYNTKELKASPDPRKPSKPKDVIYDPQGQWAHPGEVTRIPGGDITMHGVPYPVLGIDNLGNTLMMMPGQNYTFPGDYVTEYPQLKKGGLPKNKRFTNKNIQSSINELMQHNELLFGPRGKHFYTPAMKKKNGGTPEAFPQQPTEKVFFERGFVPQGPVGFYKHGGVPEAFPQQPPMNVLFAGIPWEPHLAYGGMPCFECGGQHMQTGGQTSKPLAKGTTPRTLPNKRVTTPKTTALGDIHYQDNVKRYPDGTPVPYDNVNTYNALDYVLENQDSSTHMYVNPKDSSFSYRVNPWVGTAGHDIISHSKDPYLAQGSVGKGKISYLNEYPQLIAEMAYRLSKDSKTKNSIPGLQAKPYPAWQAAHPTMQWHPLYAPPEHRHIKFEGPVQDFYDSFDVLGNMSALGYISSLQQGGAMNVPVTYGNVVIDADPAVEPVRFDSPFYSTNKDYDAMAYRAGVPLGKNPTAGQLNTIQSMLSVHQDPDNKGSFIQTWAPGAERENNIAKWIQEQGQIWHQNHPPKPSFKSGGNWIQDATKSIKARGTEGVCTGDKFGGPTCPPGSKRYNLAKTFRAMAKKQYGGASDIGDQDDFLAQYTNTFNDKLRSNTAMSIADEAAEQAANMMMQFGGMPMMDYGFSPNAMQDMYAQKADYLAQKQKEAGNRFYGATMNLAATANPWTKWTTPKAQNGAMITQDQFNQWMDAYNQKYNTPNQQQQWNYHPQYSAGYSQGMGMIPMNYNPYMQWNTRGPQTTSQGYPVPNMVFNPQNTYLQSYDYRGRLLGPGARKVSMTFRTYTDPVTGQVSQVPDTGNPMGSTPNSGGNYLTPQERQERDQTRKGTSLKNRMKNFGQNVQEYFSKPTPYTGSSSNLGLGNTHPQSVFNPGVQVPVTTSEDWSEQFRLGPLPGQRYGGMKAQYGTEVNGTSMMPDYSWDYGQSPSTGMQPFTIPIDQKTDPSANNPVIPMPQNQGSYYDTTITGKRKMGLNGEASANWIMAAITGATSIANQKEAAKTDAEMQRLTLADNQFQAMPANRIQNQGRYNWTGMSNGMFDPNSMGIIQQPGQNYMMENQVFQQGGPVELTEDEINYILANGGNIQYLD